MQRRVLHLIKLVICYKRTKKNFIELVQILHEYYLIESNYKIIFNGSFLDTNELTIFNISEEFIIYEKISI